MAGTWESQNKVIPAAYINLVTNTPLSITAGDRGTVALAQELSVGDDGAIYRITATEANYPENATAADKKLVNLALLGAKTVLLYKLPSNHTDDHVEAMLAKLKTEDANVIVYPYLKSTTSASTAQQTIASWVKAMQEEEGKNITAVLTNYDADSQYIVNNIQGVTLSDGSTLTAAETGAWIGGITAGAKLEKKNNISLTRLDRYVKINEKDKTRAKTSIKEMRNDLNEKIDKKRKEAKVKYSGEKDLSWKVKVEPQKRGKVK